MRKPLIARASLHSYIWGPLLPRSVRTSSIKWRYFKEFVFIRGFLYPREYLYKDCIPAAPRVLVRSGSFFFFIVLKMVLLAILSGYFLCSLDSFRERTLPSGIWLQVRAFVWTVGKVFPI